MKGKDFLSIADVSSNEVWDLVLKAKDIKMGDVPQVLAGKTFAMIFEKPSLRTRVSFEVGVRRMGGEVVYLRKEDVGLGTREPEADVARVLDRWVDGIIARVYSHRSLELLSEYSAIPVLNALSDLEHPCQAVADVMTMHEHKGDLEGLSVAFVGDGNNVAASLALACASLGVDFTLASPKDYQLPSFVLDEAMYRSSQKESKVNWVEDPKEAVKDADVVYTDTWVSMGHESEAAERMDIFKDYSVNEDLMTGAKSDSIFMHDMPAYRGREISDGMIDHAQSVVFDQAENRLHAQMAILAELFSK